MDTSWTIALPDVGFTAQQIGFIIALYIAMRVFESILSLVNWAFNQTDDEAKEDSSLLKDIGVTYKGFGSQPIWIKITLVAMAFLMVSGMLLIVIFALGVFSIAVPIVLQRIWAFLILSSTAMLPFILVSAIVAIVKEKRKQK